MAKAPVLQADKRKILGRKVKSLRRQGIVPANVFGAGIKSQAIQVDEKTFSKLYDQVGETNVIDLNVSGSKTPKPVLVHQVSLDPSTDSMIHIDFLQVDLTKKITTMVPLELVGESPAVKAGGDLTIGLTNMEIECVPANIPSAIELDLSKLENYEDLITVADMTFPEGIKSAENPETLVAKVSTPKTQEQIDAEEAKHAEMPQVQEGSAE